MSALKWFVYHGRRYASALLYLLTRGVVRTGVFELMCAVTLVSAVSSLIFIFDLIQVKRTSDR